jgi:hypothetical protein
VTKESYGNRDVCCILGGTMKRKVVVSVVLFAVMAGLAYGWSQNRLSGDFKGTIAAILDPSSTKDDVHAYLREARLHAHTRKDRLLLEKAEQAVVLDKEADRLSDSNFAALMVETKNPYQFSGTFFSEAKLLRVASPREMERLKALKDRAKQERAKNSASLNESIALQKADAEGSLMVMDELREILKAPGKGRYVANMAPTYDVLSEIKKQNDGMQKLTEDFMDQTQSHLVLEGQRAK